LRQPLKTSNSTGASVDTIALNYRSSDLRANNAAHGAGNHKSATDARATSSASRAYAAALAAALAAAAASLRRQRGIISCAANTQIKYQQHNAATRVFIFGLRVSISRACACASNAHHLALAVYHFASRRARLGAR